MSSKKAVNCKTAGCDRIAKTRTGFCQRCYSWNRYWLNKPVQQFIKRMQTIDFWGQRAHQKANTLKRKKK